MKALQLFMPISYFFKLIEPLCLEENLKVIFRRFERNGLDARFCIVDSLKNAENIYNTQGYSLIYFSKGGIPSKTTDWEFTDHYAEELIELTGGRMIDNCLEELTIRHIAKNSLVLKEFKKMVNLLKKNCEKGNLFLNGHLYDDIYYSSDAKNYLLFTNIDDKDIKAIIKE